MIIIGEKINGAIPAVAEALERRDAAGLQNLALQQAEAGADYLDLCPSVRRNELEQMLWLVETVQAVTDLPLCLDSPDPQVLLGAMEHCRRPGILNSVSLEKNKSDLLLPAVADSGWSCIGLLCQKNIPATAEARLEVLDRLLEQLDRYGVDHDRLYVDPMVEMVCTAENGVHLVLEVIRRIKERGGRLHVLGAVGNVSFNLPRRPILNQAFLILAMEAGIDAVILDPGSPAIMGALHAADVLLGKDEYCLNYIDAFRRGRF